MLGLQNKMIDAFVTSPLAAAFYQWFGVAPNMSSIKLGTLLGAMIISTKTWNKISPDLRPQLLEAAHRTALAMTDTASQVEVEAIGIMKKHGLEIHPIPETAAEE